MLRINFRHRFPAFGMDNSVLLSIKVFSWAIFFPSDSRRQPELFGDAAWGTGPTDAPGQAERDAQSVAPLARRRRPPGAPDVAAAQRQRIGSPAPLAQPLRCTTGAT